MVSFTISYFLDYKRNWRSEGKTSKLFRKNVLKRAKTKRTPKAVIKHFYDYA